MARSRLSALVAAGVAAAAIFSPAAFADAFKVGVDQTIALTLTSPAESVVVGNATVADVAVHNATTILITGKSFGSTNLLVLGRGGQTIYSNTVAVSGSASDQLTIVRGAGTYTYSCVDKCRSTAVVGDAPEHFQEVMTTVTAMSGAARGQ